STRRKGALRVDQERLQHRTELVPVGGLAGTGAAPPQRRLRALSRVRAECVERRLLPDQAAARRSDRHKTSLRRLESRDLDLVLRSQGIRTVIMTGVATNVCVETTARQAFLRDYYVVFTSDCTATYSQAQHDATLFNIDQFFGQVASAEEIMACWQPAAA